MDIIKYSKIPHHIRKSIEKPSKTPDYLAYSKDIESYAYIIYNDSNKSCEIIDLYGSFIQELINTLQTNDIIPGDVIIIVYIPLQSSTILEDIQQYIKVGFRDPYIYNNTDLALCKQNILQYPQKDIVDQIKYVLTQFFLLQDTSICTNTLCLTKDAIVYLKSLTLNGKTINGDGTITQKEIAGALHVVHTTPNLIHMLDIVSDSITFGKEEGVDIVPALYNFHSHPKEAYIHHNVPLAWPSPQDFIGFLLAVVEDKTICHLVISIEGIYIISLTSYWFDKPLPLNREFGDFIKEKYDLHCTNDHQINDYLSYINSINYKDKPPLIEVQYLSWVDAESPFTVVFGRKDSNCKIR